MRELKFRVWNGYLTKEYKAYDRCYITMNGPYLEIKPYRYDNDCAVEQYTGLKDKNGKEIYEGDIVDYNDDGECMGVVEYDAPNFILNDERFENLGKLFLKGAPHQRVIGNIHENPELLDKKEGKA